METDHMHAIPTPYHAVLTPAAPAQTGQQGLTEHSPAAHRVSETTRVEIYVRSQNQTYNTTQVRGHTASCTSSARAAAERLGHKLFGPAFLGAEELCEGNVFTTRWWLHADPPAYASVAPDGTLHYGSTIPVPNTAVAKGPLRALRLVVDNQARMDAGGQAADNPTRVPRWVSSATQDERDSALLLWLTECRCATTPRDSLGVVWENSIRRSGL